MIDGFNLYHSIIDIHKLHHGLLVKWLNIHSLCCSYLPNIDKHAYVQKIYYFSAYATHLNDPEVIKRHEDYIECLKSTGIETIMGRFKPKDVTCPLCKRDFVKHEEKETDVAIASKLIEVVANKDCETVILMTGDTDIIPAIKTAKSLNTQVGIISAFPFARKNKEIAQVVHRSFRMSVESYKNHQFDRAVTLSDGTIVNKPPAW